MWNTHWWAKQENGHHALARSGLIPLDMEEDPSSSTTSPLCRIRQARHKQILRHCLLNALFILLGAILIALSATLIDRSLSAWSRRRESISSQRFHAAFLDLACNTTVDRHLRELTRHPHVAGLPRDFATAEYVFSALQSYGLAPHFADYSVLLSYPVERNLSLLHPDGSLKLELSLREEDPGGGDGGGGGPAAVISSYHAYSPSGDVQGEVVYVNYGRSEDYQELELLGVDVRGAIVLARYGQIFRGDIVENAASRGAVAAIIFSDPGDYAANQTQGYFPDSSWLTPTGVQRGTVFQGNGDPLTPGWPSSTANAERIPESRAGLPTIPSLPISARDARPILESLGGKVAPRGWRGGFAMEYRTGRGPAKLRFHYVANQTLASIRNVLGAIKGYEEPDRFILLGNHRDAWTFGAVDPNSGTAALLEIASRLGRLVRAGWKPRRTIVLASWDAEEFGSVGSTEWVEENLDLLGARAVAYLNVDCAVSGPGFFAGATPQLDDLLVDVTKEVGDPDTGRGSVYDSWASRSPIGGGGKSSPTVDRLGGTDSDFVAFLQRAGVPAVDMYFGKSYPVYHSLYDNYDWMKRYGDPLFHRHVAVSSIWGLMALRLADCLVLPFNYGSYATQAQVYGNAVEDALRAAKAPHNVTASPLRTSLASFVEGAKQAGHDSKKLEREISLLLPRRTLNDRLMLAERAFLEEGGIPGRTWHKHLIYGPSKNNGYQSEAFPAVLDAIVEASGSTNPDKWDAVQHQIWRVSRVLERATLVLRGELT
ncbi:probable glutamate carboxypeptidase LAMP1 [Selaginella moellendorffii]|nr:probable glutamate carboxypeptidase LAMP1 [Selaginella moellendorffii]|eukprot:XP_002992244.2 probable glutamate carboxypeptidase LAMP1 [Selaginella moellendorffii]